MLIRINFSNNFNGKLLWDYFSDVRYRDEKFIIGNHFNPYFKQKELGVIQLVAVREIKFYQLNDTLGFACCGKAAPYLAKLLSSYYHDCNLTSESVFQHLVFHYIHRNLEVHQELLKEWWQKKIDMQPNPSHEHYSL